MPNSGAARFLLATRGLTETLEAAELVEALRVANETMLNVLKGKSKGKGKHLFGAPQQADSEMRRELSELYANWVKEWTVKLEDTDLV